jgi:predicted alpha/beta superfamily hydrolase
VASVGLDTPGPATVDGVIGLSPNLRHADWNGFAIRAAVEARVRRPVIYANDGNAAAYWEYHRLFGDDENRILAAAILGTGLGGALIWGGEVLVGARGYGHAVPRATPAQPGNPRTDNTQAFAEDLLEDVMPLIEKTYRVRPGAAARAIAGLSMGGRQALTVGLNHPDRFAWVAGMSSSIPPESAIAAALGDPKKTTQKLRWFWIGCGQQDSGFQNNQKFATLLESKGIRHVWKASEGGHDWPVWRGYLAEIVPVLFAAAK